MTIQENISTEHLEAEIEYLKRELESRDQELQKRNEKLVQIEAQLDWFKRQLFGKRSERAVSDLNYHQLKFEGFDPPPSKEEEKKIIPAHTRSKSRRKGEDKISLHPDLPVTTILLDLPEEEKTCPQTGKPLVKIGEEVTHKLAHEPGSYYIKEIIRPKYAHPEKIAIADLPEVLLPKCKADESLLAEIVTQKFGDHLPLYRIAEIMERGGIKISRKLLSQWVIKTGLALKPLYDEMHRHVLQSQNIFVDETPVKLQEKGKCKQAYMWVVVGGKESNPAYRIYDFYENRRHSNIDTLLKDYHGILHSDKYGCYQKLAEAKKITWCPCMSHIRRKFFEAESGDPPFRQWVLRKIRYLFMLERVAWARSPEDRLKIRQEKEVPILDELTKEIKGKLRDGRVLPKSKFSEALTYFSGLIPYLKNYTKDPFARLDNNVAERAIRPLAIGRKNWLFFGSCVGGEAGAVLLSLVQTCRNLKIDPREYLEDVFKRLMSHPANRLSELLPDRWLENRKKEKDPP